MNSRSIKSAGNVVSSDIRRDTLYAYLQDKIYIGNNVELTPALRYVHYSSIQGNGSGDSQGKGSVSALTPSLHGQVKFNKRLACTLVGLAS